MIEVEKVERRGVEKVEEGGEAGIESNIDIPWLAGVQATVTFRNPTTVDQTFDWLFCLGDYDAATGVFTIYILAYEELVTIPAGATISRSLSIYNEYPELAGVTYDVLIIACADFDPVTFAITDIYDDWLDLDAVTFLAPAVMIEAVTYAIV